jgi:two-component system, NarL family, nitrate/nitrite response regulator NarL
MTETETIRIFIADDFKLLRDVIRLHLERAEDMNVVGEAPDLDDAFELVRILQPDVIIMNDYLPPIDSAHAAALFKAHGFTAVIMIISMELEPGQIQRSFASGANGFLHKDEIDDCLADGIRLARQGERYLSPKAGVAYGRIQE